MMKKHRIGRVQQPWINMEPPIRAKKACTEPELDEKKALKSTHDRRSRRSVDLSSVSFFRSVHASRTKFRVCYYATANARFKVAATITKKLSPTDGCVNRSRTPDPEKQPLLRSEAPTPAAFDKKAHRLQYATELEENEIMDGLRENPSIDPETQQQILLDYRELHEQIKAEGLYKCNYSAYGYESIRYATLFGSFAFLLYHQWYLTSALFLGLFWVSSLVRR